MATTTRSTSIKKKPSTGKVTTTEVKAGAQKLPAKAKKPTVKKPTVKSATVKKPTVKSATLKKPAVKPTSVKKPAAKISAAAAKPAVKRVRKPAIADAQRLHMIATAAYYLAERRGFRSGCEVQDWFAAEAQITAKLKG